MGLVETDNGGDRNYGGPDAVTLLVGTLEGYLGKLWWQLIPMGGIIRSALRQVRQMSKGLYGAGCPHTGVECLLSTVGEEDSDTLLLQDKHGAQSECITGAPGSGIRSVSAASAIIRQEIQRLGDVDMAGLSVGEV